MFTTIPKPMVIDHGLNSDQPKPEIIDHRKQLPRDGRWSTGQVVGNKTYDSIKRQLEQSIISEKALKGRIKELEKDNEKMLEVYESTNTENTILKSNLKHGPNSQKIKQLQKDVKELKHELEIKQEENQTLVDRIKEFEDSVTKDLYLEKNWRKVVDLGRARREERDSNVGTQGPFKEANSKKKKKLKDVDLGAFETQDSRDLQIDNLEKGTLILLNKIRLFKQNKQDIDYANFIDKGAITRNRTVRDAINDKLDRDLESFASRLGALQKKAKTLKINKGTDGIESRSSKTTPPPQTDDSRKTKDETSSSVKSDNDVIDKSKFAQSKKEQNKTVLSTSRKASVSSTTDGIDKIKSASVDLSKASKKKDKHKITRSVTPDSTLRSGSPIVSHWDQLAEKLIRTEKYGGIKSGRPQNHRTIHKSNSGQQSALSNRTMRVPSPKSSRPLNAVKVDRTTDISSPTSNYTERSINSVQSARQSETVSKDNDVVYQPQSIAFVARHHGYEKSLSKRQHNGPAPHIRQNHGPVRGTVNNKTKSEEPEVIENDIEEETRDVSAYDAILVDLQKQHETHEKAKRTATVSRQQIHNGSSMINNAQSRFSTHTLELL